VKIYVVPFQEEFWSVPFHCPGSNHNSLTGSIEIGGLSVLLNELFALETEVLKFSKRAEVGCFFSFHNDFLAIIYRHYQRKPLSYHFRASSGACISTVLGFIPIRLHAAVQTGGSLVSLMCCSLYVARARILPTVPKLGYFLLWPFFGGILGSHSLLAIDGAQAKICKRLLVSE
jgi:hypothetical protein